MDKVYRVTHYLGHEKGPSGYGEMVWMTNITPKKSEGAGSCPSVFAKRPMVRTWTSKHT